MAYNHFVKYVPGLVTGQLSGKAGNVVASRNHFGSYLRTRTIPKLVQNAKTGAVRANFGANSQSWRGVSATNMAGWAALALTLPRSNTLGQTYHLTGAQLYNAINRNLYTIGAALVTVPPAWSPPVAIASATITATSV